MKKIAAVAMLFSVPVSVYAQQEPSLKVGMAVDQQLSAVIEVDEQYRFILGNEGAAFDYLMRRGNFDRADVPLDWYVGIGAWGEWDGDFGARVPLGINWPINSNIDVYGQVHPELNLHSGVNLQLGAALGITYRF